MAVVLRKLKADDELVLLELFPEQNFTQPPSRYNEATLIKALEQKGIGRPSTYAPIISTIQEREYVHKENGRFCPDDIGMIVNDLLFQHFPNIVDLNFTARLEKELDEIAEGKKEWITVLRDFYAPFSDTLRTASESIEKINYVKMTNEICPEAGCGRPMVVKTGRYGKFLACSGYPECTGKKPFMIKIGVPCPQPDCDGEIVERISKKKRFFYGCSGYPKCKFISNNKPIPQPCPQCGKLLTQSRNDRVKCTGCAFKGRLSDLEREKVGEAP
jgi:DNA topoisomerase-1